MPRRLSGKGDIYEAQRLATLLSPRLGVGGSGVSEGPGIDIVGQTVGLGGDTILLYDSGGSPAEEFTATGAGLTAALAAASSGDAIQLPVQTITLTAACTIPAGVSVVGISQSRVSAKLVCTTEIGTTLLTLSPSATMEGVWIDYSGADSASARSAVQVGESAYVRRCWIDCTNANGDARCAVLAGANCRMNHCSGKAVSVSNRGLGCIAAGVGCKAAICGFAVTGNATSAAWGPRNGTFVNCTGSGDGYGFETYSSGSTSRIIGGNYSGTIADIHVATGTTVEIYGAEYSTITNDGTLVYLQGDRAAYSVEDYHAADIEAAALTRHLPAPAEAGRAVRDTGAMWESTLTPTWGGVHTFPNVVLVNLTQGSILFIGAAGAVTEDNAKLYFEDGNLAVGDNSGMRNVFQAVKAESTTDLNTVKALVVARNTNTTNNNWAGFSWQTEDAAGAIASGARVMTHFTSHAAGAVSGELVIDTRHAGTRAERVRVESDGKVTLTERLTVPVIKSTVPASLMFAWMGV